MKTIHRFLVTIPLILTIFFAVFAQEKIKGFTPVTKGYLDMPRCAIVAMDGSFLIKEGEFVPPFYANKKQYKRANPYWYISSSNFYSESPDNRVWYCFEYYLYEYILEKCAAKPVKINLKDNDRSLYGLLLFNYVKDEALSNQQIEYYISIPDEVIKFVKNGRMFTIGQPVSYMKGKKEKRQFLWTMIISDVPFGDYNESGLEHWSVGFKKYRDDHKYVPLYGELLKPGCRIMGEDDPFVIEEGRFIMPFPGRNPLTLHTTGYLDNINKYWKKSLNNYGKRVIITFENEPSSFYGVLHINYVNTKLAGVPPNDCYCFDIPDEFIEEARNGGMSVVYSIAEAPDKEYDMLDWILWLSDSREVFNK